MSAVDQWRIDAERLYKAGFAIVCNANDPPGSCVMSVRCTFPVDVGEPISIVSDQVIPYTDMLDIDADNERVIYHVPAILERITDGARQGSTPVHQLPDRITAALARYIIGALLYALDSRAASGLD